MSSECFQVPARFTWEYWQKKIMSTKPPNKQEGQLTGKIKLIFDVNFPSPSSNEAAMTEPWL